MKRLVMPWSNIKSIEKVLTNYDESSGIKLIQKDGDSRLFTQFKSRDGEISFLSLL